MEGYGWFADMIRWDIFSAFPYLGRLLSAVGFCDCGGCFIVTVKRRSRLA